MAIRVLTPIEEFDRYIEKKIKRQRITAIRTLSYIGEQCVNTAKSVDSYQDQTGNLRSSIGYVIVEDGRIIKAGDFTASEKGTDKATGQTTGKAYAEHLASRFPSGLTLLIVAGMNYAAHVSAKGYDVIASAELKCDGLVDNMLKQLGYK